MGVLFQAVNRTATRTLTGRDLQLSEFRALRYVRERRRDPATPEELMELDERIETRLRTRGGEQG